MLVTEGRLGGFLDMKIPDEEWSMKDIHDDCCVNSNLCYIFYQMNPPDTCRYYRPPSFGMNILVLLFWSYSECSCGSDVVALILLKFYHKNSVGFVGSQF